MTMIPSPQHFTSDARMLSKHCMRCNDCDSTIHAAVHGRNRSFKHNRAVSADAIPEGAQVVSIHKGTAWIKCFQGIANCC